MDLLRATHQADQAPWSDGPQQAIAVGSLIRLLVTPPPPSCAALICSGVRHVRPLHSPQVSSECKWLFIHG